MTPEELAQVQAKEKARIAAVLAPVFAPVTNFTAPPAEALPAFDNTTLAVLGLGGAAVLGAITYAAVTRHKVGTLNLLQDAVRDAVYVNVEGIPRVGVVSRDPAGMYYDESAKAWRKTRFEPGSVLCPVSHDDPRVVAAYKAATVKGATALKNSL